MGMLKSEALLGDELRGRELINVKRLLTARYRHSPPGARPLSFPTPGWQRPDADPLGPGVDSLDPSAPVRRPGRRRFAAPPDQASSAGRWFWAARNDTRHWWRWRRWQGWQRLMGTVRHGGECLWCGEE